MLTSAPVSTKKVRPKVSLMYSSFDFELAAVLLLFPTQQLTSFPACFEYAWQL